MNSKIYQFSSIPLRCPLCSGATHIEKVRCDQCQCAIEGRFSLDWMQHLTAEQLAFVKIFVRCRGKIKDVEQALGISYPTVVARLDDIVAALESETAASPARRDARRKILDDLAAGRIDADEAARQLRK